MKQAVRTGARVSGEDQHALGVRPARTTSIRTAAEVYQISLSSRPIVGEGEVQVDLTTAGSISVGIERCHLEQDGAPSRGPMHQIRRLSYVDLNRSGVADDGDRLQAGHPFGGAGESYVAKLRAILRYLGTCDGDLEIGILARRVKRLGAPAANARRPLRDQNVTRSLIGRPSIRRRAARSAHRRMAGDRAGNRCSIRASGEGSMRSKEEAHDYRYFPIRPAAAWSSRKPSSMNGDGGLPGMPDQKKARSSRPRD